MIDVMFVGGVGINSTQTFYAALGQGVRVMFYQLSALKSTGSASLALRLLA